MSDLVPPTEAATASRLVTFGVLVVAILFSTTGELFLKAGMGRVGDLHLSPAPLLRALTHPMVVLGFALFGVGAVFWLWVISRADLSWAYPMLAM
ncbi:MAG: hypothetical protein ACE5EL_08260, partial [Anaerolineae bacterium]